VRRIRIDIRLVVAAGLALLTGVGIHAITQPPPAIPILIAATDLPPGVPLGELATEVRSMPPHPGLVPAAAAAEFAGHTLSVALAAGDPLLESVLVPPPGSRPDVAALTLDRAHAVQGELAAGDRIDIYVSDPTGSSLLAQNVLVVSAAAASGGFDDGSVALLIAVDRPLTLRLLEAMQTAEIDLVRRAR
jgi:hypothetical protein